MSSENRVNDFRAELPLSYRILLKVPKLSLESFSERFQGIFWIIVLPVLFMCDFFANLAFLTMLPFPSNCLSVFLLTLTIALLLLRILLERALNTRDAMLKQGSYRWDVEKSFQEYEQLLRSRKRQEVEPVDGEETQ
ncbi:hypothetical protein MUP01_03535 [Candidatus Bathyarchaeota archaeon]|nr:hypothetical protein [Candidatus Bathyarchaeota archaeon]